MACNYPEKVKAALYSYLELRVLIKNLVPAVKHFMYARVTDLQFLLAVVCSLTVYNHREGFKFHRRVALWDII